MDNNAGNIRLESNSWSLFENRMHTFIFCQVFLFLNIFILIG